MERAAEIAARRLVEEKLRQQRNVELRIATVSERKAELAAMKAAGIGEIDALNRLIANHVDGRSNRFSLEARVIGTTAMLKSRIQDTWAAMGNDFLGFIQQTDKIRDLITEMRGQDSGNAMAKKGSQAWLKVTEEARQWFNDKGGRIGKLDDWSMPQHHSQERVARAGKREWIADVYPLLDRSRYLDDAGYRMGEQSVKEVLGGIWDSIATNGIADRLPGMDRTPGALADRRAEHREVHFQDASAYMAYWGKYGDKTFPDILLGHVERLGRDIAFLEHFGPNPEAAYRVLRDEAESAAKLADPTAVPAIDKQLAKLDNLFDFAAGKTKPVANMAVAKMFDAVRQLNVAGKLGSAFWSSFYGDKVMLEAMGRLNHLPEFQSWFNELRLLNPANGQERRLLQRQGLMLDYMRSAMYRFGEELGRSTWTGKLANGVMRISGMSAVNEWRRGAFGLTMMDALGHEVGSKTWAQVGEQDMHLLKTFGINEQDWRIWKLAELEDYGHGNSTMLTPEAIGKIPDAKFIESGLVAPNAAPAEVHALRREAVVRYLGALNSESMNAIIEPGWRDRAMMTGGLQRGNVRDELMRSFWQFKSFPISQFQRILDIGLAQPTPVARVQFLGSLMLMQTLAGGMILQTQSLLSGEDPRPMDDWKFWMAAFIKGGTLGIYGDFLFSTSATTKFGSGPLEVISGPTIGSAATALTSMIQAGNALADGRETHLNAKLLNIGKTFLPASNLWYTRAATDHLIFQNAQEALSPGYLANMRANSVKKFGQDWWWAPGEFTPDRAPDMANALGR